MGHFGIGKSAPQNPRPDEFILCQRACRADIRLRIKTQFEKCEYTFDKAGRLLGKMLGTQTLVACLTLNAGVFVDFRQTIIVYVNRFHRADGYAVTASNTLLFVCMHFYTSLSDLNSAGYIEFCQKPFEAGLKVAGRSIPALSLIWVMCYSHRRLLPPLRCEVYVGHIEKPTFDGGL